MMVQGLIGKKLGMTQVFDDLGRVVPVTVIQAGPCVVVQKKTEATDGYSAVQLGLVETKRTPKVNKPTEGHFKRAGVPPTKVLREFQLLEGEDVEVGQNVFVQDVFRVDEKVHVASLTKGRGFQGVIKRHGFSGGRATHGSMFHRAPGSVGQSASPSRVFAGVKMPGQMGNKRVTQRGLRVVRVDEEKNLLLVKGSIPGSTGNYVFITRS
jgi:large subunit ribosomal protein L3